MNLTLEVISPGGNPGNPTRKVFGEEGGTIGRVAPCSWVLLGREVSGKHAIVSFRNGVFYIQDTSLNGISLNAPENRLVSERPYPLKSGDRLIIVPFEISVAVDNGPGQSPWSSSVDPFGGDDIFRPEPMVTGPSSRGQAGSGVFGDDEVDPSKYFPPLPGRATPRAREFEPAQAADQLVDEAFSLPAPLPSSPRPGGMGDEPDGRLPGASNIPADGYNPLTDDEYVPGAESHDPFAPLPPPVVRPVPPRAAAPVPRPAPQGRRVVSPPPSGPAPVAPVPSQPPSPPPRPPVAQAAEPAAREPQERGAIPGVPPQAQPGQDAFALLLEGAGLKGAVVTPELIEDFGQILRVVVSGVMDVLQARQGLKEEFRMRQTMFRPADNNPLKFSVNVDDALHNLLVKRNPAYLGAVEAFGDAFDDLRDHQLAMLQGMRVAFTHVLAAFDPERLQADFDASASKGALGLMPGKLRYWDLFVEKRRDMTKNADKTFTELFGEEFARAYEEQFRQLKARRGNKPGE